MLTMRFTVPQFMQRFLFDSQPVWSGLFHHVIELPGSTVLDMQSDCEVSIFHSSYYFYFGFHLKVKETAFFFIQVCWQPDNSSGSCIGDNSMKKHKQTGDDLLVWH